MMFEKDDIENGLTGSDNANMRNITASFTGHRSLQRDVSKLEAETKNAIVSLIEQGVLYFGAGGAVGYDALAAGIVLKLRDSCYPQIRLIQVLPFKGMESGWSQEQKNTFYEINKRADKIVWLADEYTGDQLYHNRNRHLVDNSAHLIAYCRNIHARSGSASCYRYAVKLKRNIILLEEH